MNTKKYGVKELGEEFGPLTFGKLLKAHRLGERVSQVQFAKSLDLSKQALNDLESGRRIPSIQRAVKIAKKIGILPELAIELVLQAQVDQDKLNLIVHVEPANYKRAA